MSGKAGSIGSILLGAVLSVVGIATANYGLVFSGVLMLAGGAVGLAYNPKAETQNMAAQQDVKFSTAATGMPVPVVFGTARVTPSFIRGNQELLETEEIMASSGGKGGGAAADSGVVGYNYFWSWEMALCMGTLEAVGQVYSMPGETPMIDAVDPWVDFAVDDYVELTLQAAAPDENSDQDTPEGGIVRLYKGSQDQVRLSSGDAYEPTGLLYRGTGFAVFGISSGGTMFCLGQSNLVRTYQFMVRRPCECLYDNGDPVVGLKVRGSDDTGNPAYHLANPAAIYWETMTNKDWGRGLSSDILDADSFIATSEYYAANNIGLGLILEQPQNIGEFLDGVQRHVKTLLTWDGEVYKLSSLLDITQTHGTILTLRDSDLFGLQLGVPFWESTQNEVRAEFTSPERGERPDTMVHQNSATVDILGGRVVSRRIQLPGFNDWNLAYQQVLRILSEFSYPWRTAQWEMNRFKSHVAIGQVVRIIWTEFTDEPVTSYWLIVKISDGASDDDKISIIAVEDQLLAPVEGEELTVTLPDQYLWQRIVPLDPDAVYLVDAATAPQQSVASVYEVPIIMRSPSIRTPMVVCFLPKYFNDQLGSRAWISLDDVSYSVLSDKGVRSVSAELVTAMPACYWDRSGAGFEFDVTDDDYFRALLLTFNTVDGDTVGLTDLGATSKDYLLIGEELIQVGLIEQVSTWRFRMRNLLRGLAGTTPKHYAVGRRITLVKRLSANQYNWPIPHENQTLYFRLRGYSRPGEYVGDFFDAQIEHDGAANGKLLGLSIRPLKPEAVSIADGGATVTLVVRLRLATTGAGIGDFNTVALNPVRTVSDHTFTVEQMDNTGTALTDAPVPVDSVYEPPTLSFSGTVTITVDKLAGAVVFRVRSSHEARESYEFAEMTL